MMASWEFLWEWEVRRVLFLRVVERLFFQEVFV